MAADDLLTGLDDEQIEAVTAPEALLAVIAAAGSGKTTVLSRRIAHRVRGGSADESHVLAVTFTRQAAGEMRRRLGDLGLRGEPTVGTFHSVAYGILRRRWADQSRPAPTLLTNRAGYLREVLGDGNDRLGAGGFAAELDWMRAQSLAPSDYAAAASERGRRPAVAPSVVAELAAAYDALKRRRGVIDFDDLILRCADELRRDAGFAEATRWRFRHFVVDEFQDINPAQFALLELLRGGRDDLCVVGDPRQAIYGWNGADPRLLDGIESLLPGIRIVRLRTNYRCAPEVVDAAASVLNAAGGHDDSRAVRANGPPVRCVGAADETEEAAVVARIVRDHLLPGGRWRSIAVLARTNAQLEPISSRLRAVGVPVSAGGRGVDADEDRRRQLLAEARELTSAGALRTWATDLASGPDGDAPTDVERELADAVRRYLTGTPGGTGRSFAEWFSVDAGSRPAVDGVELATFHAAKGREWRAVVVAGAETGLVPHAGATGAALAEEIRLLYVATTRARESVTFTWAERRGGRPTGRSRLLEPIASRDSDDEPSRAHVPLVHERADEGPAARDAVLVALELWRANAAKAARLPESAVVSDLELSAIAAARPASIDELIDVPGVSELAARRLGPRLLDVVSSALAGAADADGEQA